MCSQMSPLRMDEERGLRPDQRKPIFLSMLNNGDSNVQKEDNEVNDNRWINNTAARSTLLVALTAFYCIVMTIFGLVLELSHLISNEHRRIVYFQDMVFGTYMYGAAIAFFVYCYAVLLVSPGWQGLRVVTSMLPKVSSRSQIRASLDDIAAPPATEQRKVTHDGPSSGNLFLRLGFLVFGVIGVVYYSFSTFLCFVDDDCSTLAATLHIAAIVFIFAQMHFIFCNWRNSNETSVDAYVDLSNELTTFLSRRSNEHATCKDSDCLLGSITELMYTSIVEYSLIGAAVMFIVWHNMDQVRERNTYVKRKYQIRVDCSKTTSGLFFGLLYLSATLTSMAIFYGYMASNQSEIAATVYGITDVVQYLVSGAGCVYALWRMRLLRFIDQSQHSNNQNSSSQELLDLILLSLGLIGELIYSVAGLLGLTAERNWQALTFILLAMHIMRLLQTGIQASLIFIAGKLRIQGDDELHAQQPGKQTITFLLVANISMFLMNLFEAEKAGISETVVNFYGKRSWVFLVRSFGPLTIFFRFHSSVCLAEIWKNVYAWKSQ